MSRRAALVLALLLTLATPGPGPGSAAASTGTITWACASRWLPPSSTPPRPPAPRYMHDALVRPLPGVAQGPALEYAYLVSIGPRLEVNNLNLLPRTPTRLPTRS